MDGEITVKLVATEEYARLLAEFWLHKEQSIPFLQSEIYAAIQTDSGKVVRCFAAMQGEGVIACGVAVKYDAPLGLSFLYVPYGPLVSEWSDELTDALWNFLQAESAKLGCTFVRLDEYPSDLDLHSAPDQLARTASLQPRAEWVLDTTPPIDDIWMSLHKHARYNVRLAERAEAEVKIFSPAEAPLDDFYELMRTTGVRDGFSLFSRAYYASYLSTLTSATGFVVICYIKGVPAAAGIFAVYDRQTHYVFAGSSNDYRKIAPAYSVIWAAIKESKQRSCILFNFGGISDGIKGQHWAGVTAFKKRFGGYAVTHPNPYDLVTKKLPYRLFALYKKLR